MKIAIYCHSIAPSIDGVCRRFTGILKELVKKHSVLLFTLEKTPTDIPFDQLAGIVSLDFMFAPAYPEKKIAKPNLSSLSKIWYALRRFRPDVVHITADGFSHTFALIGLLLRIPIVGSFHTDLIDLITTHNANFFQKWCIQSKEHLDSFVLDSCATTSRSFMSKLSKRSIHCEHVIITSVDTETFHPDRYHRALRDKLTFGDKDAFLCVYVGRISREKRLDVIVDAVRGIEGAYLAIIGDGPTAGIYKALHGPKNRIHCEPKFLSHEELAEVYASSDLHISASEFETLGNTVLEAFASGIPVVVPRTQGFLDTVEHTVNGFLFEPGNSESAKSFITMIKENKSVRENMGSNALISIRGRSIENVVDDLETWYRHGIEKRTSRDILRAFSVVISLLWAVPFTMICLYGYDVTMMVLIAFGCFTSH